jgi:hypothetical protein
LVFIALSPVALAPAAQARPDRSSLYAAAQHEPDLGGGGRWVKRFLCAAQKTPLDEHHKKPR